MIRRRPYPPVRPDRPARARIAIVGCGARFPGADDPEAFWRFVRAGQVALGEVPEGRWVLSPARAVAPGLAVPDRVPHARGGFVFDWRLDLAPEGPAADVPLAIDPAELARLDPQCHLALHAARQALAGVHLARVDRARIGVVFGNIVLPTEGASALSRELAGQPLDAADPVAVSGVRTDPSTRCAAGLPAGIVARALGLGGGAFTLDAACASSLYALAIAVEELQAGRADAMLAGGLSRPDSLYTQMGFAQLRALSERGRCTPFDRGGDGLVVGEGCGLFLLKRLDDALRDGDPVLGVIAAVGLSNDVDGSLLAPASEGQLRALRAAYTEAGWQPEDIDLIECHATGTPLGDGTELHSLHTLWQGAATRAGQCVIGSVKSNIGHTLTAAGAAGLLKVLGALQSGELPPSAGCSDPLPQLADSPFTVLDCARPWPRRAPGAPRRAAVSAFGFGGINAHLLVEEWLAPENSGEGEAGGTGADCRVEDAAGTEPIAIVGLDACFGPWSTHAGVEARVLGDPSLPVPTIDDARSLRIDSVDIPPGRFRIPPAELPLILPQQLLMLRVAERALRGTGTLPGREDAPLRLRTGVFVGLTLDPHTTDFTRRWAALAGESGDSRESERAKDSGTAGKFDEFGGTGESGGSGGTTTDSHGAPRKESSAPRGPPLCAPRTLGALGGIVASRLAREFRLGGPSFTVSSEETSGLTALEVAMRWLRRGAIDRALVGAVDLACDPRARWADARLRPQGRGAGDTQGPRWGEGAAAFVLKRLADAERDGDRVIAVLAGAGAASAMGGPVTAVPDLDTWRRARARALADARAPIDRISLVVVPERGHDEESALLEAVLLEDCAATARPVALSSATPALGHAGAASGLAAVVQAVASLSRQVLPGPAAGAGKAGVVLRTGDGCFRPTMPTPWVVDADDEPRLAVVTGLDVAGGVRHVVLAEATPTRIHTPSVVAASASADGSRGELSLAEASMVEAPQVGSRQSGFAQSGAPGAGRPRTFPIELPAGLIIIGADDRNGLRGALARLQAWLAQQPARDGVAALARAWWQAHGDARSAPCRATLVAADRAELQVRLRDAALACSGAHASASAAAIGGVPGQPPGHRPGLAFLFPGSGNHYPAMGRELALAFPEVLRALAHETRTLRSQLVPERIWHGHPRPADTLARDLIFAQVTVGTIVSDVLACCGVRPTAVLGYSLGETASLFATRAWRDRDGMLARMLESPLFTEQLAGRLSAARAAWGIPDEVSLSWQIGVLGVPAAQVRALLPRHPRTYLLIENTPRECVVGGEATAVAHLTAELGTSLVPLEGVTSVHCEVVRPVAEAYRALHRFPTSPAPGIEYYSCARGAPHALTSESAADSILAQALVGFDFPRLIERAYADGVRLFIEIGPGASLTRMLGAILGSRPHQAHAVCRPRGSELIGLLQALAVAAQAGYPVDLAPLYDRESSPGATAAPDAEPVAEARISHVPVAEAPGTAYTGVPQRGAAGRAQSMPGAPRAPDPAPGRRAPARPQEPSPSSGARTGVEETNLRLAALAPCGSALAQLVAAQDAGAAAHAHFLQVSEELRASVAALVEDQLTLLRAPELARPALDGAGPDGAGLDHTVIDHTVIDPICPDPVGADPSGPDQVCLDQAGPDPTDAGQDRSHSPVLFDRAECLALATGSLASVLGPDFAAVDGFPTRVRLPDEPLMLVDRIVALEGTPRSLDGGRVITEHDIHADCWYLDCDRIPTCIAVEAGQADLFLSGYLGIDFETRGQAVYRLLDAVVTFHDDLPGPGQCIRYDIRIERFFRHGAAWFFHFHFDATVDGRALLTMRSGCAGFFSAAELAAGQGIVQVALATRPQPGQRPADWRPLVAMSGIESYDDAHIARLRAGDLAGCFGDAFVDLPLARPETLPAGERMRLVDRVPHLDPTGGRFGLGLIRAELTVQPDDWFLTCHFSDDPVMPGTLMYECCLHTLRIFLLRMGWVAESGAVRYQPVPEVPGQLKCRGQVTPTTRIVTYEVTVRELGFRPDPYAIVDALMYADGKPIVEILGMSTRLAGQTRASLEALWAGHSAAASLAPHAAPAAASIDSATAHIAPAPTRVAPTSARVAPAAARVAPATHPVAAAFGPSVPAHPKPALFGPERIRAFCEGRPSDAFGERYRVFDTDRIIARLPRDPYAFLTRVVTIEHAEPWVLRAGASIETQYDVPAEAWYFTAQASGEMPYAVLLEVALQPCGWLAAYLGSALQSAGNLSFRNLGGHGVQRRAVVPGTGLLAVDVAMTRVSQSGGMLIQHYDLRVRDAVGVVFEGDTYFGFFSKAALADQVGLRDARPVLIDAHELARAESFPLPVTAPFPGAPLAMLDTVQAFVPEGGPHGLGYLRGTKRIDPAEWFFQAHFYQDPVWPGSLGLEAFLQLLRVATARRWGVPTGARLRAVALERPHRWTYRGQVLPTDAEVTVEAVIDDLDDASRTLSAHGHLSVDGRIIYAMDDFTCAVAP